LLREVIHSPTAMGDSAVSFTTICFIGAPPAGG
jgi:hypothetical protein